MLSLHHICTYCNLQKIMLWETFTIIDMITNIKVARSFVTALNCLTFQLDMISGNLKMLMGTNDNLSIRRQSMSLLMCFDIFRWWFLIITFPTLIYRSDNLNLAVWILIVVTCWYIQKKHVMNIKQRSETNHWLFEAVL